MLDERENAFEAKYAHDQELQFKLIAKRNKLLANWAGEILGKSGDGLDSYIHEVIKSDFEEAGDDDVMRKVATDLVDTEYDEKEVRKKMDSFLSDVMNEEE